ncbi:unnamed protein product, partial [marine sediment metagenome]
VSPYSDTPLSIYPESTRWLAENLQDPEIKTYPSFTHGTALPNIVSLYLHDRFADMMVSTVEISYEATQIVEVQEEAEFDRTWDIV